ncbi:putative odorant receptor 92a [Vespa velutina]|uniref:putative odorant receptor 92a n=1 Tax=Vespa velutina TaxID=202808 RepID=UPI001FB1DD27|nr:putative odorant receptor 92a [Vespa velutina]
MEKESIEEIGIANVHRSFSWSARLLKCMGIWPLKNYVPLFLFFFTYLSLHCFLTFAHLFLAPKTMENVVPNIAENMLITMTLTKITIARMNREALRKLFMDIKEYSLNEKYETKEEKLTFLHYTKLPPRFIVISACSMTLSDTLYYITRLADGIQMAKLNNYTSYQLPYKTLQIIDLSDIRIYALICAYQILFVPCVVLGYVGFDCMFVNLSIQVIAQFSILSYKVKTVLNNSKNHHEGMKRLVLRHYRLIRFSEGLEDNFNFVIMQQLLGTTIHICISGYFLMTSPETNDNVTSFLFVVYIFSVTSTLFIYCFIGECFIQESTNFGNAIYNYEWYDLPATDSKFFLICMIRTKKPQFLTSGKFAILSLTVFTDIVKTSMGYLSENKWFAYTSFTYIGVIKYGKTILIRSIKTFSSFLREKNLLSNVRELYQLIFFLKNLTDYI